MTNPKFNEITPKYYIQFKKFIFNITKDNYFLIYVWVSESSKELPTLLREDIPYSRTLSYNISNATFTWPFPYIRGNIVIKINIENEYPIKASIIINNDKHLLTYIISTY